MGGMYLADFLAGDLFLMPTVLNWNWDGSGYFSTGLLVVILVMGMLYGPNLAASLACLQVMRRRLEIQ